MSTRRHDHGFTLMEMMVVVLIATALAALAYFGMQRAKPRANLSTTTTDLLALFRGARQNAMVTGHDTIVLVFPGFNGPQGGTGRVIVYEDTSSSFFRSTATPNFQSYDPTVASAGVDETLPLGVVHPELLARIDFPRGVVAGVLPPMPAAPAPYTAINTAVACTFCQTGGDGRGAVRFDSRGRATFFNATGAALDTWGGALSLVALEPSGSTVALPLAVRTLLLTSTTGSAMSYSPRG